MRKELSMHKYFLVALILSPFTQAHDEIYEGKYTYGNEVSVFKECGKEKVYWLEGSGFSISELWSLALAQEKPYTPIYIKFRGHEHFELVDGFQAEYEYQMYLSEVKEFSVTIPQHCE